MVGTTTVWMKTAPCMTRRYHRLANGSDAASLNHACASPLQKYVWLQGRQVWMFSKLVNSMSEEEWNTAYGTKNPTTPGVRVIPRHVCAPHLLSHRPVSRVMVGELAASAKFLVSHVKAADQTFAFALSREGKHVAAQRKIFSACFYVMGLSVRGAVLARSG